MKERVFDIKKGGHVKITGINVTRDENDYRRLSVGRKKKDELYERAIRYITEEKSDQEEALKIKGYEAFVLSVEGRYYEQCFSDKMLAVIEMLGYHSLHELIDHITY